MHRSRWKISGSYLTLLAAIGLGALVRLLPVVTRDFPLNDGGLFFRMTEDLIAHGFRLPLTTSYNGGGIPFGYPPLGFFVLGGLHLATSLHLTELMRWLPALFSLLTIPASYVLARHLLQRKDLAAMAALVFALIPRSHEWVLMGGGITRAPGMLLSMLALVQTLLVIESPTWRRAAVLGLLIGLVTLTHLEMAWFAVFSLLLLVAFRRPTRAVLSRVVAALGAGALLSGAWWIPLLLRHGAEPLLQAAMTGQPTVTSTAAIVANFTGEPFQAAFLVLALLGGLLKVFRREFLLPGWLLAIVLLDPRAAGTDASIPIGMLVAVAVTQMVLPSLRSSRTADAHTGSRLSDAAHEPDAPGGWHAAAVVLLASYGLYASLLAPYLPASPLRVSLRPGERQAAEWVNANVPDGRQFLVISGRPAWGEDPLSEWLPALTDQVSLATPQGKEWLGGLGDAAERHHALQLCAERGRACLEEWVSAGEVRYDYVLVARYPSASPVQTVALEEGLDRSGGHARLYANQDVVIYTHAPDS